VSDEQPIGDAGDDAVRVAEAAAADAAAISAFFWDAWRLAGPEAPGWAGASEEAIAELTAPEAILARIGGPERRMFLAWVGERVVGFAATRVHDQEHVELAGIVVSGDALGRGTGSLLLGAVVQWAQGEGFRRLSVKTEATNQRALGFYRSHGFADIRPVVEDVEGNPIELVELERRLGSGGG
jgi:GNAT superfamily N-acetyltransferase